MRVKGWRPQRKLDWEIIKHNGYTSKWIEVGKKMNRSGKVNSEKKRKKIPNNRSTAVSFRSNK